MLLKFFNKGPPTHKATEDKEVIGLFQNEIPRDKNGKPLEDAFLLKAEVNCNGPPITVYGATILTIGSKKSAIKTSEGGVCEARNSKIEITDFK